MAKMGTSVKVDSVEPRAGAPKPNKHVIKRACLIIMKGLSCKGFRETREAQFLLIYKIL
jgi:hypothetical protein